MSARPGRMAHRIFTATLTALLVAAAVVTEESRAGRFAASFEAENMRLPPGGGAYRDVPARRHRAAHMWRNGRAVKRVTTTAARRIAVRARADRCHGAPKMVVKVDGRTVQRVMVRSSRWHTYKRSVRIRDGRHKIAVHYVNDSEPYSCDRNLRVDAVDLLRRSAPRAPRPAPAPPSSQPGSPTSAPAVGLGAVLRWRTGSDLAQTISRLRSAGVEYSREDFKWSRLEPTRGRFDWSSSDTMMGEAARQGLDIIAIPNSPPSWATASIVTPPLSGQPLADYTRFVRAAVERYGHDGSFWRENPTLPPRPITYWDIWNEPYMEMFWAPTLPRGGDYARMFKAVVQGAKSADPNAKFMLEADTGASGYAWPQPPFLLDMFEAVPDLGRYADVVSVHPYPGTNTSPTKCTPYSPSKGVAADWKATRFQFCRIKDVRRILNARGAMGTKIWITEVGFSTAPRGHNTVSEATQAGYVRDVFRLLREWDLVEGMVWHTYKTDESDPTDREDFFGLVHDDGSPKPAWNAFVDEVRRGL